MRTHTYGNSVIIKIILFTVITVVFALVLIPLGIISVYPEKKAVKQTEDSPQPTPQETKYLKVYRHATGQTETVAFEDYVKGVVAGEMPADFEMEALKAQAVAARTYSVSKIVRSGENGNPNHPTAPVCDDTHCQVYRDPQELKTLKSEAWMKDLWPRIEKAVAETHGQLMYYQGNLVEQPLFFSSSGGRTENSEDVFVSALPYLRSVDSPYEEEATHQNETYSISLAQFAAKIKAAFPNKNFGTITANNVLIKSHSDGGRVDQIQVGSQTLTGRDIRTALSLNSANFTFNIQGDQLTFTTNGAGHGVGMSQWGANGMAKAGYDYKQILQHYYSGVEIKTAQ